MDNLNPNTSGNIPGTPAAGGSSVPPPPGQDKSVDVRTQNSDIQSIKQSGGSAPTPKQFNLGELNGSTPDSSSQSAVPQFNPSGNQAPPAGSPFVPGNPAGLPNSPTNAEPAPTSPPGSAKPGINWKKLLLIIGVIIIVAGLGYIGYLFLGPIFGNNSTPELTVPTNNTQPEDLTLKPEPEPAIHSSYLSFSTPVNPDGHSLGSLVVSQNLTNDIKQLARSQAETMATSTIGEIILTDETLAPVNPATVLSYLLPEVSNTLSLYFEPDTTFFVYQAADGSLWPGLAAKLNPDSNLFEAQSAVLNLESVSSFIPLFIENPGDRVDSDFKDGQVNSIPTRYITYSDSRAAIDYVWVSNYFIISTSYDGLKEAVNKIAF